MNPTLSTADLAARWHKTPESLANDRCAGRGPRYVKLGARVLYRLADIEAYEAERIVEPVGA
ncbi:MAG: DNA-binding protein [Tetrasphaera sp.]|nr:DNA-binding protein [Tetrasphaera sp.]